VRYINELISLIENKNYTLNLTEYFSDDDNDNLVYSYDEISNITIRFEDDFFIQDSDEDINLIITNPEGNLQIKGSLNENLSVLLPTPNSFIIQNRNEEVVAYVNGSGSLFLIGILTENVLFE